MRKPLVFGYLLLLFLALALCVASAQTAIGQSCVQTTAGNLILSPADNRAHLGMDGQTIIEAMPKKITLSEDLPGETIVCREGATTLVCKTIDQLFKK